MAGWTFHKLSEALQDPVLHQTHHENTCPYYFLACAKYPNSLRLTAGMMRRVQRVGLYGHSARDTYAVALGDPQKHVRPMFCFP